MYLLAYPWALALIPFGFLAWLFLPARKEEVGAYLKVPFFDALALTLNKAGKGLAPKLWPLWVSWILLSLALANPQWVGEAIPLPSEGHEIMLVLDLSGSMETEDMFFRGRAFSRLSVVKATAVDFVKERHSDKIGLILFGTKAYLQTPLTKDHKVLLERLEDASLNLAGPSTSLGDALGLAVKKMKNHKDGLIILLTDGANNSGILKPLQAADLAKSAALPVYTIGLGANANTHFWQGGMAELDEPTLKTIARATDGFYFRATDPASLAAVYKEISARTPVKLEDIPKPPYKNYYPWPLSLALLFLAYYAWRRL